MVNIEQWSFDNIISAVNQQGKGASSWNVADWGAAGPVNRISIPVAVAW